jgi:hypothetical protein
MAKKPLGRGWELTVYYTAVESFHTQGQFIAVRGCLEMGCEKETELGSFPETFVKAVHDEGTGRITNGPHVGKYLCWSSGSGYWVDTIPRDAQETALIPWVSAAADRRVMPYGKTFRVIDCGKDDTDGSDIDPKTCELLKRASWKIMDRFEPGLGGRKHLDLYIGEEDRPDFINSSPKEISVKSAQISID